jgi:hypothetical protein
MILKAASSIEPKATATNFSCVYIYIYVSFTPPAEHDRVSFFHFLHQHYRGRPNIDYSLLVVTLALLRATSGPSQLGLLRRT